MKSLHSRIATVFGLGAALLSLPAAATTWNYYDSVAPITDTVAASFTSNPGSGAPIGTITGLAATTSATALGSNDVTQWGTNGLGMCSAADGTSCGVPNHALDNSGSLESLLLSFGGTKVSLSNLTLGYAEERNNSGATTIGSLKYDNKADVTILAYTGTTPLGSLVGKKYSDLTAANGWTAIGNYADVTAGGTGRSINTGNIYSSYWLIAAYNSTFSAAGCSGTGTCTDGGASDAVGSDYFKVYSVAGTAGGKTPEPSSMALLGIGLLGALSLRRRQKSDAL